MSGRASRLKRATRGWTKLAIKKELEIRQPAPAPMLRGRLGDLLMLRSRRWELLG